MEIVWPPKVVGLRSFGTKISKPKQGRSGLRVCWEPANGTTICVNALQGKHCSVLSFATFCHPAKDMQFQFALNDKKMDFHNVNLFFTERSGPLSGTYTSCGAAPPSSSCTDGFSNTISAATSSPSFAAGGAEAAEAAEAASPSSALAHMRTSSSEGVA